MRRLNISAWAIRAPVPPLVLFIVLLILGVLSFRALPVERFPNIDFPLVSIVITQAGASPSELEKQVTQRVEDAVAALTGVKHITSTVTDGSSVTSIEFALGTNTDRALNDAKDAVSRIRAELPRNIDEPITSAHRHRRPADHDLRGGRAGHDGGAALLVHRRHRRARIADGQGRRRTSAASAASTARSASRSIPTGCWR